MAAPLIPILKAVAPYVAQIATIAIPAFTSRGASLALSAFLLFS